MIKGLVGCNHIVVNNAFVSTPYISSTMPSAGIMRYLNNDIQVYDGSTWQTIIGAVPSVELSGQAAAAITWAINKMQEEQKLDELCNQYPALGKARGNYETIKRLVESGIEV